MNILSRLFHKGVEGTHLLSLDLGSKTVKALFFKVNDDGKGIEIKGFGESSRAQVGENFNFRDDVIFDVAFSAKKAIKEATKKSKNVPSKIIIGTAGDLLQGDSIMKRYIRDDPQEKISISELKNFIQKIQWNAWDNIRKVVKNETSYSELDIKLINSRIQDIKIDGYRVTNPIGFTGREITISIFNTYSALEHLEFINAVTSKLDLELLFVAAGSYAVSQALIKSSEEKINTLLLDIGDFTTDITYVQESKTKFIKTLALGSRIFSQRVANELNISYKEADLIKEKYNKKLLSPNVIKRISGLLAKDLVIWLNALELSLLNISKQEILPSSVLIHGTGSEMPDIKKGLESSGWRKNLSLPRKLQINMLMPEMFKKITSLPEEVNSVRYSTLLALSVLSLDLVHNEDQINQNLRRISRIISR